MTAKAKSSSYGRRCIETRVGILKTYKSKIKARRENSAGAEKTERDRSVFCLSWELRPLYGAA